MVELFATKRTKLTSECRAKVEAGNCDFAGHAEFQGFGCQAEAIGRGLPPQVVWIHKRCERAYLLDPWPGRTSFRNDRFGRRPDTHQIEPS